MVQAGQEATILTSTQSNLALANRVLGQVNTILGEPPEDSVPETGKTVQSIKCPLSEIQVDLDTTAGRLQVILDKLELVIRRIW